MIEQNQPFRNSYKYTNSENYLMLNIGGGRSLIIYEFDNQNYRIISSMESKLRNRSLKFDLDAKAITLKSKYSNYELQNDFAWMTRIENETPKVFFIKIKFVGKGFRLQSWKKNKTVRYTFGHSHIYLSRLQCLNFKRLGKYKYFFFSLNKKILNEFKYKVITVRPINPYTLRGLKVTKSLIIKRKGRKSPVL